MCTNKNICCISFTIAFILRQQTSDEKIRLCKDIDENVIEQKKQAMLTNPQVGSIQYIQTNLFHLHPLAKSPRLTIITIKNPVSFAAIFIDQVKVDFFSYYLVPLLLSNVAGHKD